MAITTPSLQAVIGQAATGPQDVRPILPRSPENAWEHSELIRAQLYLLLEQLCAQRGIQALVLQSYPYVHPAWVKFESWVPTTDPGVTARAAMTISIHTKPYHRYQTVYKVEWERHGQKGAVDQLYEFGDTEAGRMLGFLCERPVTALASRQVKRLLRPVQLRLQWYQLWRPKNKVATIRRDWLRIASLLAVAAGFLLLVAGSQATPEDDFSVDTPVLDPIVPAPRPDEPEPVQPAARVPASPLPLSSTLDDTDPRLDDGRLFEMRTIQAQAGIPIEVTMRSQDFDTFLVVGRFAGDNFVTLQTNDDGGNDGTNSRLEFVPPTTGEFVVLFSSLEAGRQGDYSFTLP